VSPAEIAEDPGPATAGWLPSAFYQVPSMAEAREDLTATVLPDGSVLVVGGRGAEGRPSSRSELYDPSEHRFLLGPTLRMPRFNHTATLLGDGSVLVVGGERESRHLDALDSAELLGPGQASRLVGKLAHARRRHGAVGLPDGSVLVVGGEDARGKVLASVERYLPDDGAFVAAPSLRTARKDATVTLLLDGSVLVVGGSDDQDQPLDSMELLPPDGAAWEPVGPLREARYEHTATLLSDGRVLVAGGGRSPSERLSSVELYDPGSRSSSIVAMLGHPRRTASAVRLRLRGRGAVLLAGGAAGPGASTCELLLRETTGGGERWRVVAGPRLTGPRRNHAQALLSEGVLLLGGYDVSRRRPRLRTAELLPLDSGILPTE